MWKFLLRRLQCICEEEEGGANEIGENRVSNKGRGGEDTNIDMIKVAEWEREFINTGVTKRKNKQTC